MHQASPNIAAIILGYWHYPGNPRDRNTRHVPVLNHCCMSEPDEKPGMVQYTSINVCDCLSLIRHYLISHQWQSINSRHVAISVNGELIWRRKCRAVMKWATRGAKAPARCDGQIDRTNDGSLSTWSVHCSLETRLTHKEQQCTWSPYGLEFAPGGPCQGFWQSLQIKGYVRKGSLSKGDDCESGLFISATWG